MCVCVGVGVGVWVWGCVCVRMRANQVDLKEKDLCRVFFFFEVLLYPEISKTHLKNVFSYMSHFTHYLEIKPSVPHRDIHTPRY